jgi:hypothetical protein
MPVPKEDKKIGLIDFQKKIRKLSGWAYLLCFGLCGVVGMIGS